MGPRKKDRPDPATREDHASIDLFAGRYVGPGHRPTWNLLLTDRGLDFQGDRVREGFTDRGLDFTDRGLDFQGDRVREGFKGRVADRNGIGPLVSPNSHDSVTD